MTNKPKQGPGRPVAGAEPVEARKIYLTPTEWQRMKKIFGGYTKGVRVMLEEREE